MVRMTQSEELLAAIPDDGTPMGNTQLMRRLGWDSNLYWTVRDQLLKDGLITRARGRGGSVKRAIENHVSTDEVVAPEEVAAQVVDSYRREIELYEPMRTVLAGDWAKDRQSEPLGVEITALQGARPTGGRWSRPDIVSVEVKSYQYVWGKYLDVITFEVKPSDALNVQAVYEALAHRRSATHAYVVVHVPADRADALEEALEEVRTVAHEHGVGLIVAEDPADYETWTEYEEARRCEADPDKLDRFISTQVSPATRDRIARSLR